MPTGAETTRSADGTKVFSFPARLYARYGAYVTIPVLLLTILAVFLTTRLEFESGFRVLLPEDDPYRRAQEQLIDTFGQNDLVIIALDVDELIAAEDVERLDRLRRRAADIAGVQQVVSITNLQDLYLDNGTMSRRPIYRPETDPGAEALSERILETPLFRKLFVSQDERALFTYLVPATEVNPTEFGKAVISTLEAPELHFFGDSIAKAQVSRTVVGELLVLGTIAVLLIFAFEALMCRSLLIGLVLSLVSVVPSFWTLAFFHVVGGAVQTNTMMVPVIVLVLATSYGIHIYRYHAVGSGSMVSTLRQVGQVVMAAGATTLIGFASLVVTPNRILTQLGFLIMFGIVAALITALFLLPPVLDLLPTRVWAKARRGSADIPGAGGPIRRLSKPPNRPVLRLLVAAGVLAVFVLALPGVQSGYSVRDTFRDRTEIAQSVAYFQERAGATHDVDVFVDTGAEFGLVDVENYDRLREFYTDLAEDEAVSTVISYIDFVEFMVGRMDGSLKPIRPRSPAEIGEAMQLLSDGGAGLSFSAVVDDAWSRTRFLLQVSMPPISDPAGVETLEAFMQRIRGYLDAPTRLRDETGTRLAGFDPPDFTSAAMLGVLIENLYQITYLARSQFVSFMAFAPIIVIFLVLVFRSARWATIALVPTIVGVVVYFGALALFGYLHDPIHVFMVAALMGVSNDDILYFVLVFRRSSRRTDFAGALETTVHKTGTAIIQTTVTIIAGLSAFYASRFILLGRAGLIATIGLAAATATTLIVIPAVLRLTAPRHPDPSDQAPAVSASGPGADQ